MSAEEQFAAFDWTDERWVSHLNNQAGLLNESIVSVLALVCAGSPHARSG